MFTSCQSYYFAVCGILLGVPLSLWRIKWGLLGGSLTVKN